MNSLKPGNLWFVPSTFQYHPPGQVMRPKQSNKSQFRKIYLLVFSSAGARDYIVNYMNLFPLSGCFPESSKEEMEISNFRDTGYSCGCANNIRVCLPISKVGCL